MLLKQEPETVVQARGHFGGVITVPQQSVNILHRGGITNIGVLGQEIFFNRGHHGAVSQKGVTKRQIMF